MSYDFLMVTGKSSNYLPRVADEILAAKLAGSGGVIVEGPKACGKTATSTQLAQTVRLLDIDESFRQLFALYPSLALSGNTPILLDEWQTLPEIWNHVRREIDSRQRPGQFILSGSAMPAENAKGHSGLGRFARVRMRPMTGVERQVLPGEVSFRHLAAGGDLPLTQVEPLPVADLFEIILHGGWPADHSATAEAARNHVNDYVERLCAFDVFDAAGSRIRRPLGVRALLRSIARNAGQAPSLKTLTADVAAQDGSVDPQTVSRWLEALLSLFVVESVEAWSPKLRSKATARTSPVLYLADSSLHASLLGASVDTLLRDLNTAGFVFENYVYQQIATYAEAIEGRVMHYRDSNGKEFDAVVVLPDGSWLGVEVKLGEHRIEQGIAGLNATRNVVDTEVLGEPRALVLIVGGTDLAYTDRETGIKVVPIQALAP